MSQGIPRTVAVLLISAAVHLLVTMPLRAHFAPLSAEEMVRKSNRIVVATVTKATAAWNDNHNLIQTRYTLDVEDTLNGTPEGETQITVVGGSLDGETHETCLTVHLEVGARYVLFLRNLGESGFTPFTGAQLGVLREMPDTKGGPSRIAGGNGTMLGLSDKPLTFQQFVDELRMFTQEVVSRVEPPTAAPQEDPRLPAKAYLPFSASAPEGVATSPARAEELATPNAPSHPSETWLAVDAGLAGSRDPDSSSPFVYEHRATPPIVWDQLPASFVPWSPHDQYMMSRWNYYGDVHRVRVTPSNTWAWRNGSFDEAGFPPDADMQLQFGRAWGGDELAVTYSRFYSNGPMIESDIAVNPHFAWTVNSEYGTRETNDVWGYDQTILHELGHGWGLRHPWETQDVWWDSVMNYSPKQFRFAELFADDATAARTAYPGISLHDGLISLYKTSDIPGFNGAAYNEAYPSSRYVQQGSWLTLSAAYKVENVGTDPLVHPSVEVYLSPQRQSWNGSQYLGTWNYSASVPTNTVQGLGPGSLYVPYSMPPGDYWLGAFLRDDADTHLFNNSAWGSYLGGQVTVQSYPWELVLSPYPQTFSGETGPSGAYDFYFSASQNDRLEFSLCPEDSGSASFDTILALDDPNGVTVASNDDECGLQSRLSVFAGTTGTYHLRLSGYGGANGSFVLSHRARPIDDGITLTMSKDQDLGTVEMSWTGGHAPYDVRRGSCTDMQDGSWIGVGIPGTTFSDENPAEGQLQCYLVR